MSSTKYTIEKLNLGVKSNYHIWLQDVHNVLKAEKIFHLIKYQSACKVELPTAPANAKIIENFESDTGRGLSIINPTLPDGLRSSLISCESVYDLLSSVKKKTQRLNSKFSVNNEFTKLKWLRSETADDFISKLLILRLRMTEVGIQYDEQRFCQKLIDEIPVPFMIDVKKDYLRQLSRGEVLEFDGMCDSLKFLYDDQINSRERHQSSSNPTITRTSAQSVMKKSSKYCNYCKIKGHNRDECFKLKRKNANTQSTGQSVNTNQISNPSNNASLPLPGNRTGSSNSNFNHVNQNKSEIEALKTSGLSLSVVNNASSNSFELPSIVKSAHSVIDQHHDRFLFDTGASNNMSPHKDHFIDLKEFNGDPLVTGNGSTQINGVGTIRVSSFTGSEYVNYDLRGAYYVKTLSTPLFSEAVARTKMGLKMVNDISNGKMWLVDSDNSVHFTANSSPSSGNLWFMNFKIVRPINTAMSAIAPDILHQRLGHCPIDIIKKTIDNGLVSNITLQSNQQLSIKCEPCVQSKQQSKPHKGNLIKTNIPGKVVHVDSYTPNLKAYNNLKTVFFFVDEATGFVFLHLVRSKKFYLEAFKAYLAFQKETLSTIPDRFHSDNGVEFDNRSLSEALSALLVNQSFSVPYVKEQNGLAESKVKNIVNTTTSLIITASHLPKFLWNILMQTAAYLVNLRYRSSIDSSPYFKFYGQPLDIGHLRVVGTPVLALLPKIKQHPFQSKSKKMFLIGFTNSNSVFILYDPVSKSIGQYSNVTFLNEVSDNKILNSITRSRVIKSTDVNKASSPTDNKIEIEIAHHNSDLDSSESSDESFQTNETSSPNAQIEAIVVSNELQSTFNMNDDSQQSTTSSADVNNISNSTVSSNNQQQTSSDLNSEPNYQLQPSEKRKYVKKVYEKVHKDLRSNSTPDMFALSIYHPNSHHHDDVWEIARNEELNSHITNRTWSIIQRPPNIKCINSEFIYATKYDPVMDSFYPKARLVAKGYSQRPGIDFTDSYAPTMSIITIKLMLVLIVQFDLKMIQFDVKTAFLNSTLKETVYMNPPKELNLRFDLVLILHKSIYGLRQAACDWYAEFTSTITTIGFKCIDTDKCLFLFCESGIYCLLGLYVDDGLLAYNNRQFAINVMNYLKNRYTMKYMNVSKFVGLEIEVQNNESFFLHQHSYIDKLIALHNMNNCRSSKTPLPKGHPIKQNDLYDPQIHSLFRSLVSSLLYLARLSRPDIAFAICSLTTKVNAPSANDFAFTKRILQYLKSTRNYRLKFTRSNRLDLRCYVDANFSVEPRALSRTGCIVYLFGNPIAWFSRLQDVPAHSTTEAEWYAMDFGLRECLSIVNLLKELMFSISKINIMSDNQSAISICTNLNRSSDNRTKHVDRCYYFIQHYIRNDLVHLDYVSTRLQIADILTKSLDRQSHYKFLKLLCIN